MSNLFFEFCDPQKKENATTEILAYLLTKSTAGRSKFLSLIGASINSVDCRVSTQRRIEGIGQPDLVLCDNKDQEIILLENKPWSGSSFTKGDQLERYANWLKASEYREKILCLLATDENKDDLQKTAKVNPDDFVIITWEKVLDELKSACLEDTVEGFLHEELRAWFPPRVEITQEMQQNKESIMANWEKFHVPCVRRARNFAQIDPSRYSVNNAGVAAKPDEDRRNYYGYYITDKESGLTYFFGAHLPAWTFLSGLGKPSLFVLMVWFDQYQHVLRNKSADGLPKINPEILKGCGFEYEKPLGTKQASEYVHPLGESADGAIRPEELAKALAKILREVSEEINKSKS